MARTCSVGLGTCATCVRATRRFARTRSCDYRLPVIVGQWPALECATDLHAFARFVGVVRCANVEALLSGFGNLSDCSVMFNVYLGIRKLNVPIRRGVTVADGDVEVDTVMIALAFVHSFQLGEINHRSIGRQQLFQAASCLSFGGLTFCGAGVYIDNDTVGRASIRAATSTSGHRKRSLCDGDNKPPLAERAGCRIFETTEQVKLRHNVVPIRVCEVQR